MTSEQTIVRSHVAADDEAAEPADSRPQDDQGGDRGDRVGDEQRQGEPSAPERAAKPEGEHDVQPVLQQVEEEGRARVAHRLEGEDREQVDAESGQAESQQLEHGRGEVSPARVVRRSRRRAR